MVLATGFFSRDLEMENSTVSVCDNVIYMYKLYT